jgi:transcriptional regulator with PAS, ATPase and Fis domain
MLDYDKYQNLHTIIMLKDIIRKWWRVELSFADKNGQVLDHSKGEITPPQNDFCRLSLFSKEGYRRCNQSVRVLHEKFKASRKTRSCLFHDCHLNFVIVGAPLYLSGEYEGMVFVEGFARQAPSTQEAETLKTKIRELNQGATDLDRAIQRVPTLSATEVEKLTDLLEFAVSEIANFDTELNRKEETITSLSDELSNRYKFENIVGKSGPMLEVFRLLEKVAASDSTVLVSGESGTGKELVARAIHFNGPRKDKPFVVQNCSAFNDNLLESALFGHVKGAFTGALRDKKGLFEVADGGSFFLDEVGDMSAALQVKLLRVLQEGTFTPVGGTQTREVDVRVIAATHKDLSKMVEQGGFREDLFYRINVIKVQVPPLRERKDDIPVLIEHFLHKHARTGEKSRELAPATLQLLTSYTWPGNIRELENEIERLLVLSSEGETITEELISSRIRDAMRVTATMTLQQVANVVGNGSVPVGNLHSAVETLERQMIHEGLVRTRYNKSQLARELGISRSNLILKIEKFGLTDRDGEAGPTASDEAQE